MIKLTQFNSNTYLIEYANEQFLGYTRFEFTTYDLVHFMRWLYEMYERRLIKPMHIRETSDGHYVLFEQVGMEDFPYYNQSHLIHRVYNKLEDVEKIVDIFNKYY